MTRSENAPNTVHDVLCLFCEHPELDQVRAARLLNITRAASNLHFQKLASECYIRPLEIRKAGRGRPTQIWEFDPEHNSFLGMTMENGDIQGELIDGNGGTLAVTECHYPPEASREQVIGLFDTAVIELKARAQRENRRINQFFLGSGGGHTADGTMWNVANMPVLNGWNPDVHVESEFGIPAFSDSLAPATILGETDDCPRDATVALVDWSDGVGVVFACNGQRLMWPVQAPLRSRRLWDFGHLRIERDGRSCRCGQTGCLEAYVGGAALAQQHPNLGSDSHAIAERVLAGDPEALAVLCGAVRMLIRYLYWPMELFGVEIVIFTNVLGRLFPLYADAARMELRQCYPASELSLLTLRCSVDAGEKLRHGAALTARRYFFFPEQFRPYRGMGMAEKCRHSIPDGSNLNITTQR